MVKKAAQMGFLFGLLKLVFAAFAGAAVLYVLLSYDAVTLPDATSSVPLAELDISYADFLTLMLTCVTVVLAAVGIGVGVVAAYTLTGLKDEAQASVDDAVDARMKKVEAGLPEMVAAIAYGVGRNLDDDADPDLEDR